MEIKLINRAMVVYLVICAMHSHTIDGFINILELSTHQDGMYLEECDRKYKFMLTVNIIYKYQIMRYAAKL
jgi:hypothetical protein